MAASASISAGIAGRYATALFELAAEYNAQEVVETDLISVKQALAGSADLRQAVSSPLYKRDEQVSAIIALANAMGLQPLTRNTLALMAEKRRLFALGELCDAFLAMMAERRGEISAEVSVAAPLTDAQSASLASELKAAMGREVNLDVSVDETLIGGLVVKVGSKLIDTSIRSKLAALQNAMREVG
ncbi:ATP synthase F1 subcomplex delta subunit [Albimonas donghaensis]|uniref:ATP synthase subunit delta n=1 Tax=Albimonas donghaensis TaxID=356660 RepID=A0A1H2YWP3_9RHOB|nr:F0F1 ATP synthase subunit delta [Albimonas donghaensis]SDX09158.1 ATP synthase F1 subcomplex delta subunit [Albimonas donghaensis]